MKPRISPSFRTVRLGVPNPHRIRIEHALGQGPATYLYTYMSCPGESRPANGGWKLARACLLPFLRPEVGLSIAELRGDGSNLLLLLRVDKEFMTHGVALAATAGAQAARPSIGRRFIMPSIFWRVAESVYFVITSAGFSLPKTLWSETVPNLTCS